jgi:hypothetical protein
MAESSLSLTLDQLRAEVGNFLGFGQGNTAPYADGAWSTQQQQRIDSCVSSGLRRVIYPEPLEGEKAAYEWSWAKPTASVVLDEGASTIPLPDDFDAPEGKVTVLTSSTTTQPWPIEWRNEAFIRERYSMCPEQTGPPMLVALQPVKGTTATAGQRFQLFVFPLADQEYTLQLQYYVSPDMLTSAFPFPLGGAQLAELYLESCLAVAEERQDDALTVHREAFKTRLMAAVSADRKRKPQSLGYNGDRSEQRALNRRDYYFVPPATYNGSSFD